MRCADKMTRTARVTRQEVGTTTSVLPRHASIGARCLDDNQDQGIRFWSWLKGEPVVETKPTKFAQP